MAGGLCQLTTTRVGSYSEILDPKDWIEEKFQWTPHVVDDLIRSGLVSCRLDTGYLCTDWSGYNVVGRYSYTTSEQVPGLKRVNTEHLAKLSRFKTAMRRKGFRVRHVRHPHQIGRAHV